ncbi:hypothetical protein BGW39_004081 [Mortierella sp. 14UC]|nr:hypothetical protein BGW39_004081 [Mortierella sp. 14UC]
MNSKATLLAIKNRLYEPYYDPHENLYQAPTSTCGVVDFVRFLYINFAMVGLSYSLGGLYLDLSGFVILPRILLGGAGTAFTFSIFVSIWTGFYVIASAIVCETL